MPLMTMPFLDATELADLSADLAGTFDSAGQVLRNSARPASDGGSAPAFRPHGRTVACAVWQEAPRNVIVPAGGEVTAVEDWQAMVPAGTDVRAGDRLQVGALVLLVSGTDGGMTDGIGMLLLCKRVGG